MKRLIGSLLIALWVPIVLSVDFEKADLATVVIFVIDRNENVIGTGSGFFITTDGHVLTNAHVVNFPEIDRIFVHGKSMRNSGQDAKVIWVVPEQDSAILKTQIPQVVEPLTFLSEDVKKGVSVWALGYPGKQYANMEIFDESFDDIDATLTSGIASRIFEGVLSGGKQKHPIVQHTAEISPGNSGGPLINECGQVVGMNTSITFEDSEQINDIDFFAVGSSGLLGLLQSRIVGLVSENQCTPQETVEPEPKASKGQITQTTTPDPDADNSHAEKQHGVTNAVSSKQLSGIILLAFIGGIIALGYFLYRGRNIPKDNFSFKPESETHKDFISNDSEKFYFRLSGFNEYGAPISISYESKSVYWVRGAVIGRSQEFADFEIINRNISRAHAQVVVKEDSFFIRDLNSTNGTFLNGLKLQPLTYTKFSFGDEIGIATCTLAVTN